MGDNPFERLAFEVQRWLERMGLYVTVSPGMVLLSGILMLGLVSGIAVALWGTVRGSGPSRAGGEVHVALAQRPQTLDPQLIASPLDDTSRAVVNFLYEGLLRYDAKGGLTSAVAVSVPRGLDDGAVYTFQLREEAAWSDGSPVLAQDFVMAAKRSLMSGQQASRLLVGLEGAEDFIANGDTTADLPGVQAVSAKTLMLRLTRPSQSFLHVLTLPTFFPVPTSAPKNQSEQGAARRYNGPYILEDASGDLITLASNLYYWSDAERPKRLVFHVLESPQERFDGFRQEDVDIAEVTIIPGTLSEGLRNQYRTGERDGTIGLVFRTDLPPFDRLPLRQAIATALDRRSFAAKVLESRARAAQGWIPPATPGYEPDVEVYTFDVKASKKLLEQAVSDEPLPGPSIRFQVEDTELGRSIGGFIVGQISAHLGLEVDLETLPPEVYRQYLREDRLTFTYLYWKNLYLDPASWLYDVFHTQGAFNDLGYSNPELDSMLESAASTNDLLEKQRLWKESHAVVLRDVAVIPMSYPDRLAFIRSSLGPLTMGPVDGAFPGSLSLR